MLKYKLILTNEPALTVQQVPGDNIYQKISVPFNQLMAYFLPAHLQTTEMRLQALEACAGDGKCIMEICSGTLPEIFTPELAQRLMEKCPEDYQGRLIMKFPDSLWEDANVARMILLASKEGKVSSSIFSVLKEQVPRKQQPEMAKLCMEKIDPREVATLLRQIPNHFLNLDIVKNALKLIEKRPSKDRDKLLFEIYSAMLETRKLIDMALALENPEQVMEEWLIKKIPDEKKYMIPALIFLAMKNCKPENLPKFLSRVPAEMRNPMIVEEAINKCPADQKLFLLYVPIKDVIARNETLKRLFLGRILTYMKDATVRSMADKLTHCPIELRVEVLKFLRTIKPELATGIDLEFRQRQLNLSSNSGISPRP
ncbi:MAG: hypothetical protein WC838_05515 [Candidatus Margulisiibacteriota bacterium]|jgi:hypothetical protein